MVGAFAVFFGAMGSGNVQTTYAADGDVCSIRDAAGTELLGTDDRLTLAIDETVDIEAIFEDTQDVDGDFLVDVNLDDFTGDAAITSIDDNGDGDTDEINPTNHLNAEETQDLATNECGDESESGASPAVRSILAAAAEDAEFCLPDDEQGNMQLTECTEPTPGDDNDGNDDEDLSFNDADIDCAGMNDGQGNPEPLGPCEERATDADFDVATAVIVAGLEDGDSCAEIGQDVNEALIGQADEFIAFQFADFVEDFCNGDIEDNRGNAGEANFLWIGDGDETGFDDIELDFDVVGTDGSILIDITCYDEGTFILSFAPEDGSEAGSIEIVCGGEADSAEIKSQREVVETDPTGVGPSGFGTSVITVTVWDDDDELVDGVEVTFTTDNCTLKNTDPAGDNVVSPAAGGTTVTTFTDTDTSADVNFTADEDEDVAGTAEVLLDCTTAAGSPGVANITAIVQREGADIVLETEVTVVGATAGTGLTLTLTPDDIECGETILATATAVDSLGQPVSPGTVIWFTTDTDSGIVGGTEGAQGNAATDDGEASVLIATAADDAGTHTVIASTRDAEGRILAQVSDTYVCDGDVAPAAPVAPTVNPPGTGTGTGTGSITPPNTGDAGLAAGSSSSSLFVIVGAAAFILAGLASIRFARN
jgi:hypothetical protein